MRYVGNTGSHIYSLSFILLIKRNNCIIALYTFANGLFDNNNNNNNRGEILTINVRRNTKAK